MKSIIPLTALAAFAVTGSAIAQTPAYSKPSGYVTLGNPDGNPATPDVPANTDVTVSIPFDRATEFSGSITGRSGSILSFAAIAGLDADELVSTTTPYQIKITSGAQEGLIGLISANTSSSVTIGSVIAGDLAGIETDGSATFSISKAWTLGTFFPATFPAGTTVSAFSGTVSGSNLAPNLRFVWTGAAWVQQLGTTANGSNTMIFPGESLIVSTAATPINSFVVTGSVPLTKSKTSVSKLTQGVAQDNRISFTVPVNQAISILTGMATGDQLLAFSNSTTGKNKSPNEILIYTGANWVGQLGVFGDQSGYILKSGQGYVYRRAASAAVGDTTLTLDPAYIDGL